MTTGAPVTPPPTEPKVCGLAIAALICAIAAAMLDMIGLCTVGVGAVLGFLVGIVSLILSIMAMRKVRRSEGQLGGRGMAIAGLIVSIAAILLGLAVAGLMGGVMFFALTEAKGHAQQTTCQNNLKLLCVATLNYSVDHKGQFPPADTWPEALKEGRYISDGGILTCPGKANAGRTYAMNAKLGDVHIEQVRRSSETVLFFECSPGAPPAGDRADLPPEPPHAGGWLVGFCDGHVEVVSLNRRDQLVWEPKAE
jgi:prepilin-type processing-associated H-X9-DG protein